MPETYLGVEKKILKDLHQVYSFYPKIKAPQGWGSWKLQFSVSIPYWYYRLNLVKIGPVVSKEKILTHDAHRMATDANP